MARIAITRERHIIDDFAAEIKKYRREGGKPEKVIIDFRTDRKNQKERDVWEIPTELLRYRKDNGRIISDVQSYEQIHGILDEKSEKTQEVLKKFLQEKDKEKTDELQKLIAHDGQREPAIVTCDGFLINGNRRKMAMELLGKDRFPAMRVVILPGKGEEGGPPTLLEIEQIENRYQLQSEGKAEYTSFDRALSIRRKVLIGMDLTAQLRDDPLYGNLAEDEFKKAVKDFEKRYLKPLDCIDRYLNDYLKKPGLYSLISRGVGDPEGRWQAFLDYSLYVEQILTDENKREKYRIEEEEMGDIEDAAFKIIRRREFANVGKVHYIMRELRKWIENKEAKKELLKLNEIDWELPEKETVDSHGKEKDPRDLDMIWGEKNKKELIWHVKKAKDLSDQQEERETPVDLLEGALKKLNHPDMDSNNVGADNYDKAMKLTRDIQARANQLESEFFHHQKKLSEFKTKKTK